MAFNQGEIVFFKHKEHSFVLGSFEELSSCKKYATCTTDDPKRKVASERCEKILIEDVAQVIGTTVDDQPDDLLQLTTLHDSTLLRCLCLRYFSDIIYTNIGAIVVALNPFTFEIPWYKENYMTKYLDEGPRIEQNVPHSWAQAHNTWYELREMQTPQFILVSGESGAGKTEASKIVVKYFTALSDRAASGKIGKNNENNENDKKENETSNSENNNNNNNDSSEVGLRLQKCSPILESFGNARTVRNDNSSRFGKFMKIQFTQNGILLGAKITRYLLEKSRILTAAKGERVYHAFYLVCRGKYSTEFNLLADKEYKSLNSGKQLNNSDFDTDKDFDEVTASLTTVGVEEESQKAVWSTVAGIITLVNLEFISDGGEGSKISEKTAENLQTAAKLFEVDGKKLEQEFLKTENVVRGEVTVKLNTPTAALDSRDALCKATYDGLFFDLCTKCNNICDADTDDEYWIGLLDIFGFEDFEKNSFEQLCINLANETLQGHYNNYVFDRDMEECAAEGINTVDIICPDNSECLSMISDKKAGLFALLDDECSLGKGSDTSFLDAAVAKFKAHDDFIAFKVSKNPSFGVRHYAGNVTYDVANFLDKNRDTLKDALRLLMRDSRNSLIADLVPAPVPKTGRAQTVSGFFREQLQELMDIINGSNPHWIRCVKPHPAKKPKMFHGVQTMSQLESSGVLGTVKIRKAGYPVRMLFKIFLERFSIFLSQKEESQFIKNSKKNSLTVKDLRVNAKSMLDRKDIVAICPQPKLCQLGKTKVFLKSEGLTPLEHLRRDEVVKRVVIIQKLGRAYRERKPIMNIAYRRSIELIVFEWRYYLERTKEARAKKAAAEKVFREAMSEGTETLKNGFIEAASPVSQEGCDSLVDIYIQCILEREPILRNELLLQEATTWSNIRITLGEEKINKQEQDSRFRLEQWMKIRFNMMLEEFIEYQLFACVICQERDLRVVSQHQMLEELRVAAGDPEVRITLCLGMEVYKRSLIEKEGLGIYHGWLMRHRGVSLSSFFEEESEKRIEIVEEESFERKVRKQFERKRVWVALAESIIADEEYDRDFLHRSEKAYRTDIIQQRKSFRSGKNIGVAKIELERLELINRNMLMQKELQHFVEVLEEFPEGKLMILVGAMQAQEEMLRRVINEAFFAVLAAMTVDSYFLDSLYREYLQYCSY